LGKLPGQCARVEPAVIEQAVTEPAVIEQAVITALTGIVDSAALCPDLPLCYFTIFDIFDIFDVVDTKLSARTTGRMAISNPAASTAHFLVTFLMQAALLRLKQAMAFMTNIGGNVEKKHANQKIRALLEQLNTVIVGKSQQVQNCVACLLADGHLLIEDSPGVGKTTLAHALSRSFGLQFSRVQFTADLMPSDLTGVSIYERHKEVFVFHPGPIFAQVLLADEINRASPRTQSALLEAMEEKQVTIEGQTRPLPLPFFVIATQNPHDQIGTYALPESQLDRFHMRISLGYPNRAAERELLAGQDRRALLAQLPPLLTAEDLLDLQQQVLQVHAASPLLDYLQDLIAATRSGRWFLQGLSPRAGMAVMRGARAQAFLSGRDYVAPDDIASVLPYIAAHRLMPVGDAGCGAVEQVRAMLAAVPLP
jgi:MoxR-like ATPase